METEIENEQLDQESDDFEKETLYRKENLETKRKIKLKYRKRNRRVKNEV
jgi:hypothetical protein